MSINNNCGQETGESQSLMEDNQDEIAVRELVSFTISTISHSKDRDRDHVITTIHTCATRLRSPCKAGESPKYSKS